MSYFLYTVDELADEPIMLINKHIGLDAEHGMGIMGDQFQNELLQLDSGKFGEKKRIQVWINSVGGSVSDGYNIYNAILKSKVKVDTYCVGMAASTAGWIFQAGRNRVMADYGFLMMHNPYNGNGSKEETDAINTFKNSISTMLSSRCGKTCEDVQKLMDKETWMSAAECFSNGFCDSIELSSDHNKKRMSTAVQVNDKILIGNEILNKLITNSNTQSADDMNIPQITNILKLNPEASEDAIVASIKDLNNRATKAEMKKKELEDQLDQLNAQIIKEKEAKDKLKNDMEAENKLIRESKVEELAAKDLEMTNKLAEFELLKKEKLDNEAKNHLEKCTNMVTAFAKQGRIKNDQEVVNKWINKAVADHDGTKELIESLPLNKTSVKIEDTRIATGAYNAASIMADIAAKTASN